MTEVHIINGERIILDTSWDEFGKMNIDNYILLKTANGKKVAINGKWIVAVFSYELDEGRPWRD